MLQGAFRPHPDLRALLDRLHDGTPYLALHARVEPDMQTHNVPQCAHLKVLLLRDIVRNLEHHYPDGPPPTIQKVFVAINRPMLEAGAYDLKLNNTIAQDNLQELNRIAQEG